MLESSTLRRKTRKTMNEENEAKVRCTSLLAKIVFSFHFVYDWVPNIEAITSSTEVIADDMIRLMLPKSSLPRIIAPLLAAAAPPLVTSAKAAAAVEAAAGATCVFASSRAARRWILRSSLFLSILFSRVDCHFRIAPATGECRQFCHTLTLCKIIKKFRM